MFTRNISNQTTVSGGQLCADKIVVRVSENTRDHPLSTYAKFSEKLTFLTLLYAQLVFRKILRTYLMNYP